MFEEEATLIIDCDRCAMQHTHHCRDCVVTALLDPAPGEGAIVIDVEEERALRRLADEGLIPEIRMRNRAAEGA